MKYGRATNFAIIGPLELERPQSNLQLRQDTIMLRITQDPLTVPWQPVDSNI